MWFDSVCVCVIYLFVQIRIFMAGNFGKRKVVNFSVHFVSFLLLKHPMMTRELDIKRKFPSFFFPFIFKISETQCLGKGENENWSTIIDTKEPHKLCAYIFLILSFSLVWCLYSHMFFFQNRFVKIKKREEVVSFPNYWVTPFIRVGENMPTWRTPSSSVAYY